MFLCTIQFCKLRKSVEILQGSFITNQDLSTFRKFQSISCQWLNLSDYEGENKADLV